MHTILDTEIPTNGPSLAELQDMLEELQKLKSAQLSVFGTTAKLEFQGSPKKVFSFGGAPIDPKEQDEAGSSN
jgi:hypothetical protein